MRVLPEDCLPYGFTAAAELDTTALAPLSEVREMCAANRCGMYGKSWSCPPAVPPLETLAGEMRSFPRGVLLQYTAKLEDPFDLETMRDAEQACKRAFDALVSDLRRAGRRIFPMSAGTCKRCETCTYPDAPCRFPALLAPSVEACGLLVSRVCAQCGIPYYYGPNTLTYVCAVLLGEEEA